MKINSEKSVPGKRIVKQIVKKCTWKNKEESNEKSVCEKNVIKKIDNMQVPNQIVKL